MGLGALGALGQLGSPPPSLSPAPQQLLGPLLPRRIPIPSRNSANPISPTPAVARQGGTCTRGDLSHSCSQELRPWLTAPTRFSVTLSEDISLLSEHHHHYSPVPEDGFPFGFLLFRSPSSLITASPASPSELSQLSQQGQIHVPSCQSRPGAAGGTQLTCASPSSGWAPCTSAPKVQREAQLTPKPPKPPCQRRLGHELPSQQHPGHAGHRHRSP